MPNTGFGCVIGAMLILLIPLALWLSIVADETGICAHIFFPYAILIWGLTQSVGVLLAMGLLQMPVYAFAVIVADGRGKLGRMLWILLALHVLAIGLCLLLEWIGWLQI